MKKRILVFSVLFLTTLFIGHAQSDYGIKAGLNYNSNGKLWEEAGDIIDNKGKGKSGFNVGFYGKLDLGPLFLRPELVYTRTTSEYLDNTSLDFKMSRIDVPVLVGMNLIGPLDIFAGPAFQFITDKDLSNLSVDNIEDDFTVGVQIGVGLELGRLGLDLRYERGVKNNEAEFFGVDPSDYYRLDTRPEQIMFGLSYSLKNSSN